MELFVNIPFINIWLIQEQFQFQIFYLSLTLNSKYSKVIQFLLCKCPAGLSGYLLGIARINLTGSRFK